MKNIITNRAGQGLILYILAAAAVAALAVPTYIYVKDKAAKKAEFEKQTAAELANVGKDALVEKPDVSGVNEFGLPNAGLPSQVKLADDILDPLQTLKDSMNSAMNGFKNLVELGIDTGWNLAGSAWDGLKYAFESVKDAITPPDAKYAPIDLDLKKIPEFNPGSYGSINDCVDTAIKKSQEKAGSENIIEVPEALALSRKYIKDCYDHFGIPAVAQDSLLPIGNSEKAPVIPKVLPSIPVPPKPKPIVVPTPIVPPPPPAPPVQALPSCDDKPDYDAECKLIRDELSSRGCTTNTEYTYSSEQASLCLGLYQNRSACNEKVSRLNEEFYASCQW